MLTLDTIGLFTWNFGNKFHIETKVGHFEWSDPSYPGGTNTIVPTVKYEEWIKIESIPYGRDKGIHSIRVYCGENVVIKESK